MKSKTKNKFKPNDDIDIDRLKFFMELSVKEKLDHLEALNEFFHKTTSKQSRKMWEQLKIRGF